MMQSSNILWALSISMVLPVSEANAYIDAGTVSMALQVVVGAIAGGLMATKLYYRRIVSFFKRGNGDSSR
jgi:hypothetical protein